jgi:hypothetical protein
MEVTSTTRKLDVQYFRNYLTSKVAMQPSMILVHNSYLPCADILLTEHQSWYTLFKHYLHSKDTVVTKYCIIDRIKEFVFAS